MSRILLLSDIHANLAALDAVLADVDGRGPVDETWSLGDAVGYGPRPNECLDRLRSLGALIVAGNHELAAVGSITAVNFNPYARAAVEWTGNVLSAESRTYIESMKLRELRDDFTLVHGSPRDPAWEYITDQETALANLSLLETPHCVYGHTHTPAAIPAGTPGAEAVWPTAGQVVDISEGRWFLNPGSVGQPRDNNPRAAYAVLDSEAMSVVFYRVKYPVKETQHQMVTAGLPDLLVQRLQFGR